MPFFVWAFSVSPGVFFQMSPRVYLFFWWFTSLCFSSLFSQLIFLFGLPRLCSGKESTCHCRRLKRPEFDPWTGKIPCRGNGTPLQYSCLENSMDRVGSSPSGCKELDTTEQEPSLLIQCIIFWVQDNFFFFLFLLFSLTTLHHKTCVGITF